MKKTISINISGILFHIEDDGYTHLKNYLEAINRHFSHYPDNQEIISDIESRIAEIFLTYLKNNKQVITAENVESLIEKMGTIADFKASEEKLDQDHTEHAEQEEHDFYKYITPPNQENTKGYKKLTRIENRKILGGVCAGIAHYLTIDPLWTRLIAILLLFSGRVNFSTWDFLPFSGIRFSLAGWTVLAYVVLWIMLPKAYETEEDKNIKKLYRNPDDRVIGGVSSGLASYFNIEVIWVRLAFLALIFAGGSGFVIYLILWIITPLAKSITERIEMKGGAITLTNIENTILQGQNPPPLKEESRARRAFMTPFRVVGKGLNEVGTAMGPLGAFLLILFRIFFGAIIFLIGIALIFSSMIFLGTYFNLINGELWGMGIQTGDFPLEFITDMIPFWLAVALTMVVIIPAMIITVMGISIWVRRNLIHEKVGLIALFLWLISIGIIGFTLPQSFQQFSSSAKDEQTQYLEFPTEGVMVIQGESQPQVSVRSQQSGKSETLYRNDISLTLAGTTDGRVRLEQTFSSKGKNYEDAKNNIKEILYEYNIQDSVLTLDKNVRLTSFNKFRAQELEQTLYIPYNKPFVMDKSILSVLRGTLYSNGYKLKDVHSQNYWVFNENGLLCLTCRSDHKQSEVDKESRKMFEGEWFMN
ncbi:PspC domain-containing protein [Litoribacter alkaliphilus]|uniref:PspC domain-containing protein n=1 Tax=Litoribacter ruber TaxID=702568 RepID=A0AAP2CFY6_9BACT|nr:PspC domain-containing protein [Litoribacter alkaliphilus]MBS9523906.1 PspC domain-containing protein [Litoribacter alkaliphilus]